jgi:hypothetical protein
MGIYFVSYHAQFSSNYENITVILTVHFFSIGLLILYCISLLVWKSLSGKLQALVGKVKGVWSSIIHHRREHCSGEWVERFNREQDMSETPHSLEDHGQLNCSYNDVLHHSSNVYS